MKFVYEKSVASPVGFIKQITLNLHWDVNKNDLSRSRSADLMLDLLFMYYIQAFNGTYYTQYGIYGSYYRSY